MVTQSEIKYERLLEKAEQLFMELGYKAVSMDAIAETAGISKGTIYRYFSSKEQLFLDIVLSQIERHFTFLDKELKNTNGTLQKIDLLLNFNQEASKNYSLAFYHDVMSIPYITEAIIEEKQKKAGVLFQRIIKTGIEKGEIRQVDIGFMSDMLMIMIEGMGRKLINNFTSKEGMETITDNFYDFLKYGLLGGLGEE